MRSQLMVGASKQRMTITDGMFPFGFGRGMSFSGLHDDLYVRALIIANDSKKILMITLDLDSFGHIEEWKEKIQTVIDIPEDCIFVSHTHDHNSIHVRNDKDDNKQGDEDTARAEAIVWEAMKAAITGAEESIRPARYSYGEGYCDVNINREFKFNGYYTIGRNPQGPSDKTVAVLRFTEPEGKPIAFLMNYAVHGSVMAEMIESDDYKLEISADLPGYTSRIIEERYSDSVVALWTSGAAGNQDAKYRAVRYALRPDGTIYRYNVGNKAYALCEMQARDLAEEVLRVSSEMEPGSEIADIRCMQEICTVPGKKAPRPPHGSDDKKQGPPPFDPSAFISEGEMMKDVDINQANGDPVDLHTGMIVIDDICLSAFSGEETYTLGQMVKNVLKEEFRHAICLTQTNGYNGYMSEEAGFDRRVRSALVSKVARGYAEEVCVRNALKQAKILLEK